MYKVKRCNKVLVLAYIRVGILDILKKEMLNLYCAQLLKNIRKVETYMFKGLVCKIDTQWLT